MVVTTEQWWLTLDNSVREALLSLSDGPDPQRWQDMVVRPGHLPGGARGSGKQPWPKAMYQGRQLRAFLNGKRKAVAAKRP